MKKPTNNEKRRNKQKLKKKALPSHFASKTECFFIVFWIFIFKQCIKYFLTTFILQNNQQGNTKEKEKLTLKRNRKEEE